MAFLSPRYTTGAAKKRANRPRRTTSMSIRARQIDNESQTPSAEHKTGLIDLPTELLLCILDILGQDDLLSFSLLCRRFHFLALAAYFKYHRVKDLRENIELCFLPGRDCLRGLQTALLLDETERIEFRFARPKSDHFQRDLRAAIGLISKFPRVGSVTIDFAELLLWKTGKTLCKTAEGNNMQVLSQHMSRLLSVLADKSCTRLSICNGCFSEHKAYRFEAELKPITVPTPMLTVLPSSMRARLMRLRLGRYASDPRLPPLLSLREFHIASELLMCGPWLAWTLCTLKKSSRSLTSLFIQLPLPRSNWDTFLSLISLPALSRLTIKSYLLRPLPLMRFLSRHPHITSLHLDGIKFRDEHRTTRRFKTVSHLQTLRGPAEYLIPLLRYGGSFPHLTTIEVLKPCSHDARKLQDVALALIAGLVCRERDGRICLCITIGLGKLPRFKYAGLPGRGDGRGYESNDSADSDDSTDSDNDGNGNHDLRGSRSGISSVTNVDALELSIESTAQPHDYRPFLRWLAMFPALTSLTFVRGHAVGPTVSERRALVRQIAIVCPNLHWVAFFEDKRTIAEWEKAD